MHHSFALLLSVTAISANVVKFDKNLVFRSPFLDEPQVSPVFLKRGVVIKFQDKFAHDTVALSRRNIHPARRDTVDAARFKDELYPGFFGSDFSNVRDSHHRLTVAISEILQGPFHLELGCELYALR